MDPFVSVIPLAIRPSWKLFIIDLLRAPSRFNSWASVVYHLYSGCQARGQAVQLYADDTQLYGNSLPMDAEDLSVRVLEAINAVESWMSSN